MTSRDLKKAVINMLNQNGIVALSTTTSELSMVPGTSLSSYIYNIRGQQVMIDSQLAKLYQVETKYLNRAVKRNFNRFPEDFCFQLTTEEYENLKCQIGTSSSASVEAGRGGRRTLPFVFTEQGVSMLASVLHSAVAVDMSIAIMRTFVEMRHFIANNEYMFERIKSIELKQLEFQKETNEKFEKIFEYISEHEECTQKIFFNGQIYDAFSLLSSLIQKAEKEIILIDGYVDTRTLDLLSKKQDEVSVLIRTFKKGCNLTNS